MVKVSLRFLVVSSIAILALSGCAPAVSNAGPTTSASSRPTASPTPTKPTLSELVVSPDGLGYLVVGQPVPAVPPAIAIMHYDPTKCVGVGGTQAGSEDAGAWVPNYPSDGDVGMPFEVGPVTGPAQAILGINIWSPELKTAKHLGVGSTPAQLTAAYGSALSLDAAEGSDVYILHGSRTELLFEVPKPALGLPADKVGVVALMRVVPTSESYLHFLGGESGVCAAG